MLKQEIQSFRKDLKIWTSYVNRENLEYVSKKNLLPIFIARQILNSNLIGTWQGSPVHFSELAPSPDLLRGWKKYGKYNTTEFKSEFLKELSENVNPWKIFRKLDILCHLSCCSGVILFGYGEIPEKDHRFVVSEFLNDSFLLDNKIQEYVYSDREGNN